MLYVIMSDLIEIVSWNMRELEPGICNHSPVLGRLKFVDVTIPRAMTLPHNPFDLLTTAPALVRLHQNTNLFSGSSGLSEQSSTATHTHTRTDRHMHTNAHTASHYFLLTV